MRIGVEVGGTFTDLVQYDGDNIVISKTPSVPSRPDEGIFNALQSVGADLTQLEELVHGSTVAVNAILERKGARICFFTTRGFRDILHLQRQNRTRLFDLFYQKPEPVVSRVDTIEIDERIMADGTVLKSIDVNATREAVRDFLSQGKYDAVAICLLNAYSNPANEIAVADIVADVAPEVFVTRSSEVGRLFREYERASTTTLAAYVQPTVNNYLDRLEARLGEGGFAGSLNIMQSNGGRLPVAGVRGNALVTLFSGPSAGVVGAIRQVMSADYPNLITLDVGGTSADVCLVSNGKPDMIGETEISGLPVHVPVIDIVSVGAGGGSILWKDPGAMFRVGPESAGANPGPVCYGKGGTVPTLTDAQLVRGALPADTLLAGNMPLAHERTLEVVGELAAQFGMDAETLSESAARIANSNIISAIKAVSTERGKDPRDYVLVPFGGAGPLHGTEVADELGITTVIIPPYAGVLSAYGLLASEYHVSESMTRLTPVDAGSPDAIRHIYADLLRTARERLHALGITADIETNFSLDMRFTGQAFEIAVPIHRDELAGLTSERLRAHFQDQHSQLYQNRTDSGKPMEIVAFRLQAWCPQERPPHLKMAYGKSAPARSGTFFFNGSRTQCPILSRGALDRDASVTGPCIIEDSTSTTLVSPGWQASIDDRQNLVLRKIP